MKKKIETFIYWITLVRPIYAILKGAYQGIKNVVIEEQMNRKNYEEIVKFYKDNENDE